MFVITLGNILELLAIVVGVILVLAMWMCDKFGTKKGGKR